MKSGKSCFKEDCESSCVQSRQEQQTDKGRERGQKKKLLDFDAQARQGLLKRKEDELLGAAQQMSQREYWQFGARLRRVEEWTVSKELDVLETGN